MQFNTLAVIAFFTFLFLSLVQPANAAVVVIVDVDTLDLDGWIFQTPTPNACKSGHRYRMNDQFRRVVERAGMDPVTITPHVLRHTAITKLVQAGVDLPTIQTISGHKTLAMVLRYTHVHGAHIDAAMDVLNAPASAAKPDTITPKLHKDRKR